MANELIQNIETIQTYLNDIRGATFAMAPDHFLTAADNWYDLATPIGLRMFVPDSRKLGPDISEDVGSTSLAIAHVMMSQLSEGHTRGLIEDTSAGPIHITLKRNQIKNTKGQIFAEAPMAIEVATRFSPQHTKHKIGLNFRLLETPKGKMLGLYVDSSHKGSVNEYEVRRYLEAMKYLPAHLRKFEEAELNEIKEANHHLHLYEQTIGLSLRELTFALAFAFARGIGADALAIADDHSVTTRRYYERQGIAIPYAPHNWISLRMMMKPPITQDEAYWYNPYPQRLDPKFPLYDSFFFYTNTDVEGEGHYRDLPRMIGRELVSDVITPFEEYARQNLGNTKHIFIP